MNALKLKLSMNCGENKVEGPTMRSVGARFALIIIALFGIGTNVWADGADEAMPSFYEEPGQSRTRDYVNQHASEKIDPFTGQMQWHFVDLFIPGNGGMDLKVQPSYSAPIVPTFNSPPWEFTATGLGWTMHFGRVLRSANNSICDTVNGSLTDPVLELPDGGRRQLYLGPDNVSRFTTDLWKADCNTDSPSLGLNVFSPDGTKYEMTVLGHQVGTI